MKRCQEEMKDKNIYIVATSAELHQMPYEEIEQSSTTSKLDIEKRI